MEQLNNAVSAEVGGDIAWLSCIVPLIYIGVVFKINDDIQERRKNVAWIAITICYGILAALLLTVCSMWIIHAVQTEGGWSAFGSVMSRHGGRNGLVFAPVVWIGAGVFVFWLRHHTENSVDDEI